MFADVSLARQIDLAEGRLCALFAEAVGRRRADARALVLPLAGGLAVFAGAGSPSSKAIGVAIGETLEPGELDQVEAAWRERGEPMRVELSSLADPSAGTLLTSRGYRLINFEDVLGRALDGPDDVTAGAIEIGVVEPADARTWLDVAIDGFAAPDDSPTASETFPRETLEEVLRDIAEVDGLLRYLARIDGQPAGEAALRIDGDLGQLAGAATLPAFRRRGVQNALLYRRLADARRAGCRLAVVTTQPGSRSQSNAKKRGFALLYTRAVLVREWTG